MTNMDIEALFKDQLANWELVADNYANLKKTKVKELDLGSFKVNVQCNYARIFSSGAKVDSETIKHRKCYLCEENRPSVQKDIKFHAPSGDIYNVLVNPYPIFRRHLTIVNDMHKSQTIHWYYKDMLAMAEELDDYDIFYNGPRCGASAPDHQHFQAVIKGNLPLLNNIDNFKKKVFYSDVDTICATLVNGPRAAFYIESSTMDGMNKVFDTLFSSMNIREDDIEPMINVLTSKSDGIWKTIIFARKGHRPHCYYAKGRDRLMISPASVEMAGVIITPLEEDFHKVTSDDILGIMNEVLIDFTEVQSIIKKFKTKLSRIQKSVSVGIVEDNEVSVNFLTEYKLGDISIRGRQNFKYHNNMIEWNGSDYAALNFFPEDYDKGIYEIEKVKIGKGFHWERLENEKFQGSLVIIVSYNKLNAINIIGIEDYLTSVIASEMAPNAPIEFLKAHSIISRSWLMATIEKRNSIEDAENLNNSAKVDNDDKLITWQGHEDHQEFDVCADDHCQRYHGIDKKFISKAREIIEDTWGEVMECDGNICNAVYSKCCGGRSELYSSCWEDIDKDYLQSVRCCSDEDAAEDKKLFGHELDLTNESDAEKWILSFPPAFCGYENKEQASDFMVNFDKETTNYYRWNVSYTQDEIRKLISKNLNDNFGEILDLIPIRRGPSGRIIELKIVGTQKSLIIGKELEIRKVLSESCLYSSAFVVKKEQINSGEVPQKFILFGAGWGHGVGLCQIGASLMGLKGYNYKEILNKYYKNIQLVRKY